MSVGANNRLGHTLGEYDKYNLRLGAELDRDIWRPYGFVEMKMSKGNCA